ncbi:DUF3024 domain-containing protein, partial [Vibrio lentus]|uniref:DUF3024 domain-containing protein n=1 Tax=Vibrio lentus TaxID=136468 RepID=UPI0010569B91
SIFAPLAIRAQIDFVAEMDNQSLMLYELSSSFSRDGTTQRYPVAKITYVKTKKHWVLYGMRASGKWMKHSSHTLLMFSDFKISNGEFLNIEMVNLPERFL